MSGPLIQLDEISVRFGAVVAVDGVSFHVDPGETLGLVGDNGAGKSTVARVLSGAHPPTAGRLYWQGSGVTLRSVRDARERGIDMVYQDLGLVDALPIVDNVFLGREKTTRRFGVVPVLDAARMREETSRHLDTLGVTIDSPDRRVETLSMGQRQAVAIARTLVFDPQLIIMDEPTASLAVAEVQRVLDLIRRMKRASVAVVLISHRLEDVFGVCDRIVVLRRGRLVADTDVSRTSPDEIVAYITGARAPLAGRGLDDAADD